MAASPAPVRLCTRCKKRPAQEEPRRKFCPTCLENARRYALRYRAEYPELCRERYRRWRTENPEKAREATRRWVSENPDKARESRSRYQKEHKELRREKASLYREKNRDILNERMRRYTDKNRAAIRERSLARYAENPDRGRAKSRIWRENNRTRAREVNQLAYRKTRGARLEKMRAKRDSLDDAYIKSVLKQTGFDQEFPAPALVELKRAIILAKRELQSRAND